MGWIDPEPLRLFGPTFVVEFEWGEAFQHLQPTGEVIGVDEVREMVPELVVTVVVTAFDGCLLDGKNR